MPQRRALGALAVAAVIVAALAACAPDPAPAPTTTAATPTPTSTPTPTATPDPLAGLSLEQRVGQLFIVGTAADAADPVTLDVVARLHIGGVFLSGRSSAGVDGTAAVTAQVLAARQAADPSLWIATDQEGGDVQVLSGDGFSEIPSALDQSGDPSLAASAARWGSELIAAGVDVDLAPVADIVTQGAPNPPIGDLDREYGYDRASVAAGAGAFADGMRQAGVLPTFKHFPGLGRVADNTDTNDVVHDTTVGADSDDVAVYRDLLAGGPSMVMVSSAIYDLIDPSTPALFSPVVVGDVLRGRVGFDGVVMTDDVSAAAAVSGYAPGDRATMAIGAGVDVVLVSADPTVLEEMYDAVLAKAQSDAGFAALVDAAALRVVTAKADGA